MENKNIFTTKQSINYGVTFSQGKPESIIKEDESGTTTYFFDPTADQEKVTVEIFEEAMKGMIRSNLPGFEILYICLHDRTYQSIAIKVFKEHWNSLYNTVVADVTLRRKKSLNEIGVTYDFFEGSKFEDHKTIYEKKFIEGGTKEAATKIQELIKNNDVT